MPSVGQASACPVHQSYLLHFHCDARHWARGRRQRQFQVGVNPEKVLPMKPRFAMLLVCAAGTVSRVLAQGCPTSPATPLSPINTNVAVGNVTFNWSASPASGVTGYEVYAGTTTANAARVCSTNGATSCTGSLSTD